MKVSIHYSEFGSTNSFDIYSLIFHFYCSLIPPSQATALAECQHQFESHRWNCTFSDKLTEDAIIQRGLLEGNIVISNKLTQNIPKNITYNGSFNCGLRLTLTINVTILKKTSISIATKCSVFYL